MKSSKALAPIQAWQCVEGKCCFHIISQSTHLGQWTLNADKQPSQFSFLFTIQQFNGTNFYLPNPKEIFLSLLSWKSLLPPIESFCWRIVDPCVSSVTSDFISTSRLLQLTLTIDNEKLYTFNNIMRRRDFFIFCHQNEIQFLQLKSVVWSDYEQQMAWHVFTNYYTVLAWVYSHTLLS